MGVSAKRDLLTNLVSDNDQDYLSCNYSWFNLGFV